MSEQRKYRQFPPEQKAEVGRGRGSHSRPQRASPQPEAWCHPELG